MPSTLNNFAVYGRSKGHVAINAAAYASRSNLWCDKQLKFVDYTHHPDICLHSEIMLPEGVPKNYADRQTLWNAVEKKENRKDAQLVRRNLIGLPCELSPQQRLNVLKEYIHENFVSKGMIADFSIHAPDKNGDARNFHAHILLTTRKADQRGFYSKKTREWNSLGNVDLWRKSWTDIQNRAFTRYGLDAKTDHRTLKAQQIEAIEQGNLKQAIALERTPEIHIGRKDWKSKENRFQKNQDITRNNRDSVTVFSQKLRAFDAGQTNRPSTPPTKHPTMEHTAFSSLLYQWELAKALYGDYAAPDRPMNYWHLLRDLINSIPIEKRSGEFKIPNFDKPPLKSTNKRSTAKYPRPKQQPPLFSRLDLHDLFKRHADHLTFGEKIRLALSYADAIANIRAGRSHQLQMMDYRQIVRKTHDKAWKRHRKIEIARYRGRRLLQLARSDKK